MPITPLIGFAPDVPSNTPGAIIDCAGVVPTVRGMRGASSLVNPGYAAIPGGVVRGAANVQLLNNTRRQLAASSTDIYELSGGVWTSRSRGGGYTAGSENRFRFQQFGNVTIACNQQDILQYSTGGAFADIAGSPKARFMVANEQFIMVFATNEGTYGDDPSRWWCSAIGNYASWTPSIATQCATAQLVDIPGELRAAGILGDAIVAYKDRGIMVGTYVGAPQVWSWECVVGEWVGAVSQEALVQLKGEHVYFGSNAFWRYDGTRPQEISVPVREWFLANTDAAFRYRIQGFYDRFEGNIYWYLPGIGSAGVLNICLVYNIRTQAWGRSDRNIQFVTEYVNPGLSFSQYGTVQATFGTNQPIAFGSTYWASGVPTPAVFDSSGVLQTVTGPAGTSTLMLADVGDDVQKMQLQQLWIEYIDDPSGTPPLLQNTYRETLGGTPITGPSSAYHDGRFDVIKTARWHRNTLTHYGDFELRGTDAVMIPAGVY
jgi:hypothetical protein